MDIETAKKARDIIWATYGKDSNIVGVGITTIKRKGGIDIDMKEWGVVLFVMKKLRAYELRPDQLIPPYIEVDGKRVWTDVIESRRVEAHTCLCNTSRCRPLEAGVSGSSPEVGGCTITGGFIDRTTNTTYILTNAHCTTYSATCKKEDLVEREIIQPSPIDGGRYPDDTIGVVKKASDLTTDGYTDTALILPYQNILITNILHGTSIYMSGTYREPLPGEEVVKSGRTTYVTRGRVIAIGVTIKVDYRCTTRTVYDCIVTTPMSQPGDSGSPTVTEKGEFVGQLFAGSDQITALINPKHIAQEFNISITPYTPKCPPLTKTKLTLRNITAKLLKHLTHR